MGRGHGWQYLGCRDQLVNGSRPSALREPPLVLLQARTARAGQRHIPTLWPLDFTVCLVAHRWRPVDFGCRRDASTLAAVYFIGGPGQGIALRRGDRFGHCGIGEPVTTTVADNQRVMTVSQLNRAAKDLLETYLPLMWVEGELSNFSCPSSGHWYFTLKDARAQVRCAMFRNRNQLTPFRPKEGDKLKVRAHVSLYEGRGDFQLIVEHMAPAGRGDLQQQYEQLKAKLGAEGLFSLEHKAPLPTWLETIAVVTSPTGAAIHDILNVLKRRAPHIAVKVIPVAVQGNEAPQQIVDALTLVNRHSVADLIIVGRGGGSLEDLWAFNDERVARAIFASKIPVVSAVGHEVDVAISDLVADVRAPTPSAAAELVSPNMEDAKARLAKLNRQLNRTIDNVLQRAKQQLQHTQVRLQHPATRLMVMAQRLDQWELRLNRAMRQQLANANQTVSRLEHRLWRQSPQARIAQSRGLTQALTKRLRYATETTLATAKQRFAQASQLLHGVSPLATLERGYSITLNPEGKAIREVSQVRAGETLTTRLHQGELDVQVTAIRPPKP